MDAVVDLDSLQKRMSVNASERVFIPISFGTSDSIFNLLIRNVSPISMLLIVKNKRCGFVALFISSILLYRLIK